MAALSGPTNKLPNGDSIDKEQLKKFISFQNEVVVDFAPTSQVDENPAFRMKFEMGDIKIPVSLEDIVRLKQISEEAPYGMRCNLSIDPSVRRAFQIDSAKVLSVFPTNFDAWLVARHLRLNIDCENVEVKLDKLILYEIGGHFKQTCISNQIGTIGTVILQLPVEGGHEGGRLVVEYQGKRKTIETNQSSAQSFYLSSFYNSCHHFMEPVTKGYKLTLVYNLFWKNLRTEMPHDFPVFLTAFNGIRKILNSWIPHTSPKELAGDVTGNLNNLKEIDDPLEVNPPSSNESLCSERILKQKMLYIPLEEKYDENYLTFKSLRGEDRKMSLFFEDCWFLELHLAIVLRKKTKITKFSNLIDSSSEVSSEESCSSKILRWIDADNLQQKLNIELDWDRQCVGPPPFRNELDAQADMLCREDVSNSKIETQFSHHVVLVIWPKHLSIQIYCRYGLTSLLEQLEDDSHLATLKSQSKARHRCIQVLKRVISLCNADPQTVWTLPGMEKGELTLRLLRLCITLQTCVEGLILLKILGSDFREESNDGNVSENFEGIQNEQVAQAIAEFESFIGWDGVADLIKLLVTPRRISHQLIPIIKLAKYFLNVNCVEGAIEVGDAISSSFSNMDNTTVAAIKQSEVEAFIDMVVSLETNSKSSSKKRKEASVNLFLRLEKLLQCRLAISFEAQYVSSLKSNESCTSIFEEIYRILSVVFDFYNPILNNIVVEVMGSYIRLGNAEWVESLITAISLCPVGPEFPGMKKNLLKKLISSPVMKELATSSQLGTHAMILLFKNHFVLLVEELSSSTREVDDMCPTVLSELSSCLKVFIKQKCESIGINSTHKSEIPFVLLEKLEVRQLLDLLIDVLSDDQCSSNSEVSSMMCKSLFAVMKAEKVPAMLYRKSILDAVKYLNRLEDKSLIEFLLKQVCANEIIGSWDRHFKYELFDNLISSSDIWKALSSPSKFIVAYSCVSLVTLWIMDDCRQLESPFVVPAQNLQIFCCVQLYFLVERNGFGVATANSIIFERLLSKLSLSQLMNLLLDFYESEIESQPSFKQFAAGLDWFQKLCRHVFSLDFVSIVNIESRVEHIYACLFMLEDEQCWQHFASQLCSLESGEKGKIFIEHVVRSSVTQQAVVNSSLGLPALTQIMDYWITNSSKKPPPLSWEQPDAVFESSATLQDFLRSANPSIFYGNFQSRKRAVEYAHLLVEKGITGNFNVEVKICTRGKFFRCLITKIRRHENSANVDEEQYEFVKELVELRRNLTLRNETVAVSGELTINPSPSKRQRNAENLA